VNTHTNDINNRMSLTSFERSAAETLRQPLPPRTAKYIVKLAATIIERGGGYTEDDGWDALKKLMVVPRDTIQVCEILTFCKLIGLPVRSNGLMDTSMFRNPSGHLPPVTAYHPTPVLSSQLLAPRIRWAAHLDPITTLQKSSTKYKP
jgi:hypothetical protein